MAYTFVRPFDKIDKQIILIIMLNSGRGHRWTFLPEYTYGKHGTFYQTDANSRNIPVEQRTFQQIAILKYSSWQLHEMRNLFNLFPPLTQHDVTSDPVLLLVKQVGIGTHVTYSVNVGLYRHNMRLSTNSIGHVSDNGTSETWIARHISLLLPP